MRKSREAGYLSELSDNSSKATAVESTTTHGSHLTITLSVNWSRTICCRCRRERRACAQCCVVETYVLSTSVVLRQTSETPRCELPRDKHTQATNHRCTNGGEKLSKTSECEKK